MHVALGVLTIILGSVVMASIRSVMVLVVEVVLYLGFFSVIMPTVTSSKYVDKEKKGKTREKKTKRRRITTKFYT